MTRGKSWKRKDTWGRSASVRQRRRAHGWEMEIMSCGWSSAQKDSCWEESQGKVISSISGAEILKNIWPTDGAQCQKFSCGFFFSEADALTLLRAERGMCKYFCVFGMKDSGLGRGADIGMTGLWGRRCLSNDYYHRNLSLAVLNTALDFHLVLLSLPFSEQTGEETGKKKKTGAFPQSGTKS